MTLSKRETGNFVIFYLLKKIFGNSHMKNGGKFSNALKKRGVKSYFYV
jgi:hypothetical protein